MNSPFPAARSQNNRCSIAIDLGTTTLAGSLMDASGQVLAEEKLLNPQQEYASDILTRLERAHGGDGEKLQSLLVAGLCTLVEKLVLAAGVSIDNVVHIVAAGNPGMSCLLSKAPVESLLFPPHKAVHKDIVNISAREIGLKLSCPVTLFPQISAFVGGDLTACLMGLGDVVSGTLVIDLGTNAEIALWDGERWWVTSAAAGPAFETGNISAGMIHGPGAVTDVSLDGDSLKLQVCGNRRPQGLCGSGLVALVASALQGRMIDASGTVRARDTMETNLGRYLVDKNDSRAIRFYRDATSELLLTQDDIRSLQLAKGAVRAGVSVLLEKCCFSPDQVSHVYLTGALGLNVSKTALKRVAMLPEPMVDKTSFIPNGVLGGLQEYVASKCKKNSLGSLVERMQPFPLSGTPAFEKHYMKSLNF